MAKEYLFEIGTEEIPAGFMPSILAQLKDLATKALDESHLSYKRIETLGTPRRLALLIHGLEEQSADISETHKGPSAKIAYDENNNPTKAAIGFAKGKGLDVSELKVVDGYIYAETTTKGVKAEDILKEHLLSFITSLSFGKSMHWANRDEKFVRPLRWLVSLLDDQVVPVEFAGVTAGHKSRGHRFLSKGDFEIAHASDYVQACEENFVMVDQNKRRQVITEQLQALAAKENAAIVWDDDLLEEILYLVEWPTALCGGFESSYLELPEAAIITPMKDHQRYFPLRGKDGKLLPKFLTVRNGNDHSLAIVQAGNERVLRARLDDAKFFFNEDRKQTLGDRIVGLTKIVFQEGLGNLLDKTNRLVKLGQILGKDCGLNASELEVLSKATGLAKTDLTTGMVTEFTELQGVMGKEYALLEGVDPQIAEAIFEQYLPRFAGDILPNTKGGKILSIVDKIDNIVATFSRGLIPTGSQDPYALRRQTIGILNILLDSKWNVSLKPIFREAAKLLDVKDAQINELIEQVNQFFKLRLKNIYNDQQIPYTIVDLLLSNNNLTVVAADGLGKALLENRIDTDEELVQAYTRMYNLIKDVTFTGVNADLLKEKAEINLYKVATEAARNSKDAFANEDFKTVVTIPSTIISEINQFFEDVMVMDKDENVKNNRLQLVSLAYSVMGIIGDISTLK